MFPELGSIEDVLAVDQAYTARLRRAIFQKTSIQDIANILMDYSKEKNHERDSESNISELDGR
jgi:hypothetical protein